MACGLEIGQLMLQKSGEQFKRYCIRDVDAEREIRYKLRNFPIPEQEQALYRLDQEINDRGVLVDQELVSKAVQCDTEFKIHTTARAYELTGLENPTSLPTSEELAG